MRSMKRATGDRGRRNDRRGLKGGDNRGESLPRIVVEGGGARMKYYRSCRVGSRFIALASD